MKKRNYRAQKVDEIRWEKVADPVKERPGRPEGRLVRAKGDAPRASGWRVS